MIEMTKTITLWFCQDCLIAEVNGDHNPDRPETLPKVLSKVAADDSILVTLLGLPKDQHSCLHTCSDFCDPECGPGCQGRYCCCANCCADPVCPDENTVLGEPEEDCDCGRITYATSPCDGCGDDHHGSRNAFTAWLKPVNLPIPRRLLTLAMLEIQREVEECAVETMRAALFWRVLSWSREIELYEVSGLPDTKIDRFLTSAGTSRAERDYAVRVLSRYAVLLAEQNDNL